MYAVLIVSALAAVIAIICIFFEISMFGKPKEISDWMVILVICILSISGGIIMCDSDIMPLPDSVVKMAVFTFLAVVGFGIGQQIKESSSLFRKTVCCLFFILITILACHIVSILLLPEFAAKTIVVLLFILLFLIDMCRMCV